jgi:hypothetical protein
LLKPLRKKSSKRRVEYRQKSKGTACITYWKFKKIHILNTLIENTFKMFNWETYIS